MSPAPYYCNTNYATLSKYLILNHPTYDTPENGLQINWADIDTSLQDFTPITDAKYHALMDYAHMNDGFRVRSTSRKYKVILSRFDIS